LIPSDLRDLARVKEEGLEIKKRIETFAAELKSAGAAQETAAAAVTQTQSRIDTLAHQIAAKSRELGRDIARDVKGRDDVGAHADERTHTDEHTRADELKKLEEAFSALDQERTSRLAAGLSQKERLGSLRSAKEKVIELQARATALEKQHAVVGRLADAAAGRAPNLSRVGFQRYVLGSRLDEVLEQASRRLFTMSRGQFALRRSKQIDDKRKNAGLDLEVEDALSGTRRPTASLSGGEGFLASLALALGLADVVQNHLGGVRLDAVFVDEGFGTLDPEALEQAIRTLTDLQAGGRMVGIISHVPELRDQIAKRLVIKKGLEGSTIAWES
jgi:exonuclease SbcC